MSDIPSGIGCLIGSSGHQNTVFSMLGGKMIFNTESFIQSSSKSNKTQGELKNLPPKHPSLRFAKDGFPQNVDGKPRWKSNKKENMRFRNQKIQPR